MEQPPITEQYIDFRYGVAACPVVRVCSESPTSVEAPSVDISAFTEKLCRWLKLTGDL